MDPASKKIAVWETEDFPYELRHYRFYNTTRGCHKEHQNPGTNWHHQWSGQKRSLETWGCWYVELGRELMQEIKPQESRSKQRLPLIAKARGWATVLQ